MGDETLAALDHEAHVARALEVAREAAARGDHPYGSLSVRAADGERLMVARTAVETANDVRRAPNARSRTAPRGSPRPCTGRAS